MLLLKFTTNSNLYIPNHHPKHKGYLDTILATLNPTMTDSMKSFYVYKNMKKKVLLVETVDEFTKILDEGHFDFLDFGCSKGESIGWSKRFLGGKQGLGIDINKKKVTAAQAAGYDAVVFDIHKIPEKKAVRFTVMSHFLEHVPNISDVNAFLKRACQISTDFVFIKQPYFDADGYLFQNGLKLYWSDWTGHPNDMTTLSIFRLLRELKNEGLLNRFSIHGRHPILSSDDSYIQSITAPIDQHHFDSEKHPPKIQGLKFEIPVFKETVIMI